MISAIPYHQTLAESWDEWTDKSKNGTFLLKRDYMEYHSDRFLDASLIFENDGCIVGAFPANYVEKDKKVVSHGGLTYGGMIMSEQTTGAMALEMLTKAVCHYKNNLNASVLYYKPTPYIYHNYPSDEELYALHRLGASLHSRCLATSVLLDNPYRMSVLRRRGIKKAEKSRLKVYEIEAKSCEAEELWRILSDVLEKRHGRTPVHNLSEIRYLTSKFSNEIEFYVVKDGESVIGGCVVYNCGKVAHSQYIASSDAGRLSGALDLLFAELLNKYAKRGFRYFDFGISTENEGKVLNEGLLHQKEGFGGRGICYDCYKLDLTKVEIL